MWYGIHSAYCVCFTPHPPTWLGFCKSASLWSWAVEKKRGERAEKRLLYSECSVALRGGREYSWRHLFQVCWFSQYLISPLCFFFSWQCFYTACVCSRKCCDYLFSLESDPHHHFRIAICGNCKAPLLTFYAISLCPVGPPRLEAMVTVLFEITVSKSQYYFWLFAVIDEKKRQSLMWAQAYVNWNALQPGDSSLRWWIYPSSNTPHKHATYKPGEWLVKYSPWACRWIQYKS